MNLIQKRIKKYLEDRDWADLRPGDIAKSISIESAELLELFQWDSKELDDVRKDSKLIEKISKELADVLIYALDMAVLLDIDPEEIISQKLDYIDKKYPADLMKNRKDKTSKDSDDYWKIKREYRQKNNE